MTAPLPVEGYRTPEPALGPLEAKHGPAFQGRKAFWWTVRTAVFAVAGLFAVVGNPLAYGGWVLCAVAFVHALIVWDFRRHADVEVHVHRDGLRVHLAGAWRTLAWDDVKTYTTRVDRVGSSIMTMNWWSSVARTRVIVGTREGDEIELTSAIDGLLKIGARIRSESLSRLRRTARAELDAGKSLTFGRLSLDRDGIYRGSQMLPWSELESVEVDRGDIVVRRKKARLAWSRDPYPGTPNAHLFVDLLERHLKRAAK
ncbi:MAG: hypothetical protein HYV09_05665 [Deltaproteobacteria bacterium]|nr:hypothetical protein [Deltaproteobacteria bacterium]